MSGEDRPDGPGKDESTSSTPDPLEGARRPPEAGGELDQPAPRFDEEFVLEIDEEFLSSTMDGDDMEFVLEDPGGLLGAIDGGSEPASTPVSPLPEEAPTAASESDVTDPAEPLDDVAATAGAGGDEFGSMLDELSSAAGDSEFAPDESEDPSEEQVPAAQETMWEEGYEETLAGVDEMDSGVESGTVDPFEVEEVATFDHHEDLAVAQEATPDPAEADLDTSWFAESAEELAAVPTTPDAPIAEEWADDAGFGETEWSASADDSQMAGTSEFEEPEQSYEPSEEDELAAVLAADEGMDSWHEDEEGSEASSARSLWIPAVAAVLLVAIGFFALQSLAPSLFDSGETQTDVAAVPTPTPDPVAVDPEPVTPDPTVSTDPLLPDPDAVSPDPTPTPPPDPLTGETPGPGPTVSTDPLNINPGPGLDPSPEVVTLPTTTVVTPEPPQVRIPSADETMQVRTTNNHIVELRPGETIVELKNGHLFKGRMKRIRKQRLTLADGMAEYTFHLDEIRILEENAPEYVQISDLPAAAVTLLNGQRLRGRLVKETEEHVVLAYESGSLTVPKREVASVSFAGRVHF